MPKAHTMSLLLDHVSTGLHQRANQALQEQLGIGMTQLVIMRALRHGKGITQRQMATQLSQTEAAISRQIKLLQEKRLIATKVNALSKRERLSMLTPKGEQLAVAAEELLEKYTNQAFAGVAHKKQRQMLEALEALHAQVCRAGVGECEHTFTSLYGQK